MKTSRTGSLIATLLLVFCASVLSGCGGGGASAPAAPSGLAYATPPAFVVGQTIAALNPTVTGKVTGYSVSPSLPNGLSLDATTGVLSGTPLAVSGRATYTVQASNTAGASTTTLSLVVNDRPPASTYQRTSYVFTIGVAGSTGTPTNTGGAVVSWSISPALPDGLALGATTGVIGGTATSASAGKTYTVTATNSGGPATVSLTLAVNAPLVELGHTTALSFMRLSGADLLSQDGSGHWALWNFAGDTLLAEGESQYTGTNGGVAVWPVDLAGTTAVVQTASGLEVRAASDGHVLTEIPATLSWWRLAADGSYVGGGNGTDLTIWSTSGQILFSESGDYSQAVAFAAPTQLQIAQGGRGTSMIETVSVPGGTSVTSAAYQGSFGGWFEDGSRFFSTLNDTVWVYSNGGMQQELVTLPSVAGLSGEGNWFWTLSSVGTLSLYAVGSGSTPAATYSGGYSAASVSGTTLALLSADTSQLDVVDLSISTPGEVTYILPVYNLSAFAAASRTSWVVGNHDGVLVDGSGLPAQSRYLDYGAVWSLAGSDTGVAAATASARVLYFNTVTNTLQTTLPVASSAVSLSADGTVLAVGGNLNDAGYQPYGALDVYSMPAGSLIGTYAGSPSGIVLSGSGTALGEFTTDPQNTTRAPCDTETILIPAGGSTWCDVTLDASYVVLSPDGTLVAAQVPPSSGTGAVNGTTVIYRNGVLTTTLSGQPLAWLDDSRLLVETLQPGRPYPTAAGSFIYNAAGTQLASLPNLPDFTNGGQLQWGLSPFAQPIGTTAVYSPWLNAIYSQANGTLLWNSTLNIGDGVSYLYNEGVGKAAGVVGGSEVVYPVGHVLVAEPYTLPQ